MNGGPLDGTEASPEALRAAGAGGQLLLTEVDGAWHAYLAVPHPEQTMVLSHVGEVERPQTVNRD